MRCRSGSNSCLTSDIMIKSEFTTATIRSSKCAAAVTPAITSQTPSAQASTVVQPGVLDNKASEGVNDVTMDAVLRQHNAAITGLYTKHTRWWMHRVSGWAPAPPGHCLSDGSGQPDESARG